MNKSGLSSINRCFHENFESLSQYKRRSDFHRCLSKLTFEDVLDAVKRADKINRNNQANSKEFRYCAGYSYYRENPSLSINEVIKKILIECGLILPTNRKR